MKKIRILATTDIHGYVSPYSYSNGKEMAMGLAKLNPLIKKYRDENSILVDCGDNLQGNPMMFYYATNYPDKCSPITKVLNKIKYDYYTIGNHDLNYGTEYLLKHVNEFDATCLTGNLLVDNKPLGKDYVIHTFKNGARIGIIGLLTDYIAHWEKAENIARYTMLDQFDYCKKQVETLKKENVDAIVVIYHGGLEKDEFGNPTEELTGENIGYRICDEIDGVDLLISGHQHRSFIYKINNTVITQHLNNAKELAYYDIDVENHLVTPHIEQVKDEIDYELIDLVKEEEKEVQAWLDTPLGHFKQGELIIEDEFEARLHKHPLISFLNQVKLETYGGDITPQSLYDDVIGLNHDITMRNLVNVCPFTGTFMIKEVNGKVLKEFLEKCAEYFIVENDEIAINPKFYTPKILHFNYDMVDGIEYTIHASYPEGHKVTDIYFKGKEVKDDDIFKMVIGDYRANGGGEFHMMPKTKTLEKFADDSLDVLRDYILNKKEIEVKHYENIHVVK